MRQQTRAAAWLVAILILFLAALVYVFLSGLGVVK